MTCIKEANGYHEQRFGIAAALDERLYKELIDLVLELCTGSASRRVRSVMLTAPQCRSGVSYLASCMASMMAEDLGSTLLVDALAIRTLGRVEQHSYRSNCKQINHGRLWVLGACQMERFGRNPRGRLSSLSSVMETLYLDFEFVVVDAPALSLSSAADALAPCVDGSILVVIPDRTDLRQLTNARRRLGTHGGHVLGAIYNTVSERTVTGDME